MRSVSPILLAAVLAAPPEAPPSQEPSPSSAPPPAISVQVLEEAWRVGDEKTYTLLFDRAPFGRHAMRLVALRDLPEGGREAIFRQRITLDLRALGQEGSLEHSGTIVYGGASGPYRYREGVLRENGYATYRKGSDYRSVVEVELDPASGTYRVEARGSSEAGDRPLPPAAGSILLDLLALGHWERVFAARPVWSLGEIVPQSLLVPSPSPRFDYHLPVREPRTVFPTRVAADVTVEARETLDLFGAQVEAFRCRIVPPGLTLWVSPLGGVLRFQDGRGLAGALEP